MEREVKVLNKLGLHARPAAEFVRCVRTFTSTIEIEKNGEIFSGSSILDVLSANLNCGAKITIKADGPDAEQALEKLCGLLHRFKDHED